MEIKIKNKEKFLKKERICHETTTMLHNKQNKKPY